MSDQNRPPEDEDWGPASPWQQPQSGGYQQQPPPPAYQPPPPTPSYQQQPGYQQQPYQQQPSPGYGISSGPQQSNTAQTLAIVGIVCILICSPAAIVLGLMAQSKYRQQHAPDTLAKIAWIGGIASLVISFLYVLGAGSV